MVRRHLRTALHRSTRFPGEVFLTLVALWWLVAAWWPGSVAARGTALQVVTEEWHGLPVLRVLLVALAACSLVASFSSKRVRLASLVGHSFMWTFIGGVLLLRTPLSTGTGTYLSAGLVLAPLCVLRVVRAQGG